MEGIMELFGRVPPQNIHLLGQCFRQFVLLHLYKRLKKVEDAYAET